MKNDPATDACPLGSFCPRNGAAWGCPHCEADYDDEMCLRALEQSKYAVELASACYFEARGFHTVLRLERDGDPAALQFGQLSEAYSDAIDAADWRGLL